jgi:hypothetical protein
MGVDQDATVVLLHMPQHDADLHRNKLPFSDDVRKIE